MSRTKSGVPGSFVPLPSELVGGNVATRVGLDVSPLKDSKGVVEGFVLGKAVSPSNDSNGVGSITRVSDLHELVAPELLASPL